MFFFSFLFPTYKPDFSCLASLFCVPSFLAACCSLNLFSALSSFPTGSTPGFSLHGELLCVCAVCEELCYTHTAHTSLLSSLSCHDTSSFTRGPSLSAATLTLVVLTYQSHYTAERHKFGLRTPCYSFSLPHLILFSISLLYFRI